MNNITNCSSCFGEEIGSINVSIYKNYDGVSSFKLNANNDNVLQVSYVIEDTLKLY